MRIPRRLEGVLSARAGGRALGRGPRTNPGPPWEARSQTGPLALVSPCDWELRLLLPSPSPIYSAEGSLVNRQ